MAPVDIALVSIENVYKSQVVCIQTNMSGGSFFSIIAFMILAAGGLDIYAQTECDSSGWAGYTSGGLIIGSMIPNMLWVWSRRSSSGREPRFGDESDMIVKGSLFLWIAMFMSGLFLSGLRHGECGQDMFGWISLSLLVLSTASAHMVTKSD